MNFRTVLWSVVGVGDVEFLRSILEPKKGQLDRYDRFFKGLYICRSIDHDQVHKISMFMSFIYILKTVAIKGQMDGSF